MWVSVTCHVCDTWVWVVCYVGHMSRISVYTRVSVVSYVSVSDVSCEWRVSVGDELCESCHILSVDTRVSASPMWVGVTCHVCDTWVWVMCCVSHMSRMSVDTRVGVDKESWIMPHILMSRVTYECVYKTHVWVGLICHVCDMWVWEVCCVSYMSHMSVDTYVGVDEESWAMPHIHMSRVTYECVYKSHVWLGLICLVSDTWVSVMFIGKVVCICL